MVFDELYQEIILDHSRNPRNREKLDHVSRELSHENPSCGDQVKLEIVLDAAGMIEKLAFDGQGCAISMASASLMTERLKGRTVEDARNEISTFLEAMRDRESGMERLQEMDEELAALGGVIHFPMRVKCATLAWHGMEANLDRMEKNS
jgi:nitrogen fixation NifU-like protein